LSILCNKRANLEVPIQLPINTLHYILTWQILREEFIRYIKYMLFEKIHSYIFIFFYPENPDLATSTVFGGRPKGFEYHTNLRAAQCMA